MIISIYIQQLLVVGHLHGQPLGLAHVPALDYDACLVVPTLLNFHNWRRRWHHHRHGYRQLPAMIAQRQSVITQRGTDHSLAFLLLG